MTIDAPLSPAAATVDGEDRLHSLDILRGLALFFMIVVHFHQRARVEVSGAEDLLGWAVYVLVEQKSWGTFAFLFGVGFAVLLRRLEARGLPVVPIYLRRMATLAVFGAVAHIVFGFHILFEYAWWGTWLLFMRRWSSRSLLATAVLAVALGPLLYEGMALYAWWTSTTIPVPAGAALRQAALVASQQPDYLALLHARAALFFNSLPHTWRHFVPDTNLALFLVGLLSVRHGIIDEPLRHLRQIRAWMIFGAATWAASWLVMSRLPSTGIRGADWPIQSAFGLVQDQWLCFTYIGAALVFLARRPWWIARLSLVAAAGRMALTNYVVQAALLDILTAGYGLALHVRPLLYAPASLALFGAEAAFSRAWLARYRFGPLEWVWRSATYAAWPPLRRAGLGVSPQKAAV